MPQRTLSIATKLPGAAQVVQMLLNRQWYLKQRVPLLCTLRIAQARPQMATYSLGHEACRAVCALCCADVAAAAHTQVVFATHGDALFTFAESAATMPAFLSKTVRTAAPWCQTAARSS